MVTAKHGHSDVCQLLIQHGADVNRQRTEVHHDVIMHCCLQDKIILFLCTYKITGWSVTAPLRQWLWSAQHSGAVRQVWGTAGRPNQGSLVPRPLPRFQCYTQKRERAWYAISRARRHHASYHEGKKVAS
jgi:hypothetical protein